MCSSKISLSKITHQMWHNHPFSQRNKTTERAVGGEGFKLTWKGGGVGQNLKKRIWQYRGVFIKHGD